MIYMGEGQSQMWGKSRVSWLYTTKGEGNENPS